MKFRIFQPQAIHERGSRPNQEDSIFPVINTATANDRLFILCDGMGGHESGEVASGTVCQTISNYILSRLAPDQPLDDALFEEALSAAYAAVNAQDTSGQKKMGTTLTFLCFHKGGCTVAHIGDSRVYHLRPSTNEILYRSRDHSLVYDLFEVGEMTYEELKTAKNKNVITRVIMANQERPSKADIVHITNIKPGDYFYLCSDGMLEQMDDQELMEIFKSDRTDEQKRKVLVGQTVDNSDNHSAYIIHIESVEGEIGDELLLNDEEDARAANKILLAELDPSSVTMTAPLPPPPPAAPTQEYEEPINEVEDDVQMVVNQPEYQAAPQQYAAPQQQYTAPQQQYAAPQKSNSMMKWGILAALFMCVCVAVAVLFFVLSKSDDKPEVTIPTNTETPVTTPVRHNSQAYDDDYDDRHSHHQSTSPDQRQQNRIPTVTGSGRTNTSGSATIGGRRISTSDAQTISDGKHNSSGRDPRSKIEGNNGSSVNGSTSTESSGNGSTGNGSTGNGSTTPHGKLNPEFKD